MSKNKKPINKIAIETNNLAVGYTYHEIISDVNLCINEGEFVYLIGANGSGKSTLIKTLLGLTAPLKGQINIFGKKLSQEVVANNFAYVPQYIPVERDFPITVEEIIRFECSLAQNCQLEAEDHLRVFGAQHLLDRTLKELSGGELQRVLIARALLTNSRILVLDEPSNSLDKKARSVLKQLLRQINQDKKVTVVYITHNHHIEDMINEGAEVYEVSGKKLLHLNNHV